MNLIYFPIIVSVFAIAFVWFLVLQIRKVKFAGENAGRVWDDLRRQYRTTGIVAVVLFILLLFLGLKVAIGFLLGAVFCALAEIIAMDVSNQANVRIALAAKQPRNFDVKAVADRAGGLIAMSLGLLVVSGYYFFTKDLQALIGLALGAGLIAFFSKKSNTTADVFETYALVTIGAMTLGALLFPASLQFTFLPLILGSVSILVSIVGSFFVKPKWIFTATIILMAVTFYLVISKLMFQQAISVNNLYFSSLLGLIISMKALFSGKRPKYIKYVPLLLIIIAAALSYYLAGFYGVALATVAMVSTSAIMVGDAEAKKYSMMSAGLASLILFFVYFEQVSARGVSIYSLDYVRIIAGVLLGAIVSSLFVSSLGMAKRRKIFLPGLVILLAPILVGFILGAQALAGLLIGVIILGVLTIGEYPEMNKLMKGVGMVALLILVNIV